MGATPFQDIQTQEFHCPSGVNVKFDGVAPSIASAAYKYFQHRFYLPNLTTYTRE